MSDNRTTELLPCPFCGGNARLTTWTPTAASISCIMCGAHFNTYTEAEAIAAWNTRATHSALTAEQVRKVLLYYLPHREYYSVEQTDAWQAIADELNELGSGTCHITASATNGLCSDNPRKWFKLSCGHSFTLDGLGAPVACAGCGKMVER